MFAQERHKLIVDSLSKQPRMTIRELERLVKASPATIRRDLRELEGLRRIVRVHGGVMHPSYLEGEPTFAQRSRESVQAKIAMADEAAALIPANAAVFIDSGTTCLETGRRLMLRDDLTLFTNSLPLASLARQSARIICVGGEVREVSHAMVGALALKWLSHLRFDCALIGASGLCPKDGASTTELKETAIKQELIARARRRILVADSSKWDHPAAVNFGQWKDFHCWVTDGRVSKSAVEQVRKTGAQVCIARS